MMMEGRRRGGEEEVEIEAVRSRSTTGRTHLFHRSVR